MTENGLHERLRVAAGERTYRELGKITGTHSESVRRYMQGQSPSVEFLTGLCSSLGINGDWLLTGSGPMQQSAIRDHALRDAGTPDLLRAMSDTVSILIERVDRLERFVQTAETRLRHGHGAGDGEQDERAAEVEVTDAARRIGSVVSKRPRPDAD
ncbi:MAG: helix-turn-helix transcriptional regulator [Phycisphaeraceae bacterium]|nr:MAG: helix-turn-helix transcriptional regulator [Phycisphaeraceae bacterium]